MTKSIKLTVRVNEEIYNELLLKMKQNNITNKSVYIRQLMMFDRPLSNPEIKKSLKNIQYEIAKIGVNVNQIVKNNNSYLYSESDKIELKLYFEKLESNFQHCIKELESINKGGRNGNN